MTCLRRKDCVRECEGGGEKEYGGGEEEGKGGEEVVVRQEFPGPTPFLWKAAVWEHCVYLVLCLNLSAHTCIHRPRAH